MARSFSTPDLFDSKGRTVIGATCKAFRVDTHALVETQYTDSSGNAAFTALPDAVDCSIIATWGINSQWFFSEAPPALGDLAGDLDDISNGTSYGRTLLTALTSGEIDLSLAGVINKIADNIVETATKKWAAETGADITGDHTAADITGQGTLATRNTVATTHIDNLAVTNAKINTMVASKLTAGTVNANLVIGTQFATEDGDVVIDDLDGIKIWGEHLAFLLSTTVQGRLYVSGGDLYVRAYTGDLYLQSTIDDVYIAGAASSDTIHMASLTSCQNHIRPNADGTINCGDASYRWNLVRGVTITSGDLGFEERHCHQCLRSFRIGDKIALEVIGEELDEDVEVPIIKKVVRLVKRPKQIKTHRLNSMTGEYEEVERTASHKEIKPFYYEEDGKVKSVLVERDIEEFEDIEEQVEEQVGTEIKRTLGFMRTVPICKQCFLKG